MAKSTTEANRSRKKVGKRISAEQFFARSMKQEQAIVERHNRDLANRRKELLKTLDMEQVIDAINAEKKMYDAAFKNFMGDVNSLDKMKAIAGKMSRDRLIKKIPAIRRIMEFNNEGKRQLSRLLHPTGANVFDPNLVLDPVVVTSNLSEFDIFEPPFDFPREVSTSPFEDDWSFTFPQWGLLGSYFKFKHSDWGSVFGGNSHKYGNRWVEFGLKYRTKKTGKLEVYFQVRNLIYNVDFAITDNAWFSDAQLSFVHDLTATATSVALPIYEGKISVIDGDRSSGGGDVNGPPMELTIPPDEPIFVKVTTEPLGAGYNFTIRITAKSSINSNLTNMDAEVNANILWWVEKVYMRVV